MSHMDVFRPADGKDLIIKSDLAHGLGGDYDVFKKDPLSQRPATQGSNRFGRLSHNSFFARHNPHPGRVRHLKGLLDVPICSVSDDMYISNPRYTPQWPPNNHNQKRLSQYSRYFNLPANAINVNTQSHPINTITGLQYFMGKPLNYRIFSEKIKPRPGITEVNEAWKDELKALTSQLGLEVPKEPSANKEERKTPLTGRPKTQYSEATGRIIPPPSRAMSRGFSRASQRREQLTGMAQQFNMEIPNSEEMVMTLLCQILQTEDINAVQQWLVSAGEQEKVLVMDLIRAALSSQDEYYRQQPKDVADFLEKKERERPVTGILGDSDDPLNKIDRLTLEPSSPPPELPVLPPTPKLSDEVRPPTAEPFRAASGRSSRAPSRLAPLRTPSKPQTPAKLKYTSNSDSPQLENTTWKQNDSTVKG